MGMLVVLCTNVSDYPHVSVSFNESVLSMSVSVSACVYASVCVSAGGSGTNDDRPCIRTSRHVCTSNNHTTTISVYVENVLLIFTR